MRLTFLYPIPLLALLACSDDEASNEGNGGSGTAGSAGSAGSSSNSGGSAGSSAGGDSSGGGGDSSGGSSGSGNAGGTANNGGSAGTGNGAANCTAVCARSLDCSKDERAECLDSCETAAELCPTEAAAAQACALPRPDSDFHCEDGQTTLNDGVCDSESGALLLCVARETLGL